MKRLMMFLVLVLDKRKSIFYKSFVALFLYAVTWTAITAYADTNTSINPTTFEWKLIAGLLGIIQILIGYIYISGMQSLKASIRILFKQNESLFHQIEIIEKEKISWTQHEDLCRRMVERAK